MIKILIATKQFNESQYTYSLSLELPELINSIEFVQVSKKSEIVDLYDKSKSENTFIFVISDDEKLVESLIKIHNIYFNQIELFNMNRGFDNYNKQSLIEKLNLLKV